MAENLYDLESDKVFLGMAHQNHNSLQKNHQSKRLRPTRKDVL